MFLAIFHPESRRVFRGKRARKSPFGHMFGGAADYSGLSPHRRQPPAHLLFRLNTADPAVGVALPGVEWLPMLCAIRYAGCNLGYRVVSNSKVKILHQAETKACEDFGSSRYPEKLPPRPVVLEEGSYDPGNVEDALFYAGVFGYEALSPKQYARLVRYVESKRLADMFGWESAEAYLEEGNDWPFLQARPADGCPDPACPNHSRKSSLRTFAIFQEEEKKARKLWGPYCENLQIVYQLCPECMALRTSSQCT